MCFKKILRIFFGLILIIISLTIFFGLLNGIQSVQALGMIYAFFSDLQMKLNYGLSGFSSFDEFELTRIHFMVFFVLCFSFGTLLFFMGSKYLFNRNGKKKIFLGMLIILLIYLMFTSWYRYQLTKYMNNYSRRGVTYNGPNNLDNGLRLCRMWEYGRKNTKISLLCL